VSPGSLVFSWISANTPVAQTIGFSILARLNPFFFICLKEFSGPRCGHRSAMSGSFAFFNKILRQDEQDAQHEEENSLF
jgi:hypothetical protein